MLELLDFFSPPAQLPGAMVRISVALAFTAAAAYFDAFNKKWVPNYLVYGFVLAGLALNAAFFDQQLLLQALALFALTFGMLYPLYRLGQLGGADLYALSSISLCIPYLPSPLLSSALQAPYPFILTVLAPTGVAFIAHMLLLFIPYISRKISRGEVKFTLKKMAGPALLAAASSVFFISLSSLSFQLPPLYAALLSFLLVSLFFFSLFKDEIKGSMVSALPVSRLKEEDVLALEAMDPRLVKRLSLTPLITSKTIAALRKSGPRRVPVYTGMPCFLPYLLFGLVVSVLFGDVMISFLYG